MTQKPTHDQILDRVKDILSTYTAEDYIQFTFDRLYTEVMEGKVELKVGKRPGKCEGCTDCKCVED